MFSLCDHKAGLNPTVILGYLNEIELKIELNFWIVWFIFVFKQFCCSNECLIVVSFTCR